MFNTILLTVAFSLMAAEPKQFTMEDLLRYKCDKGNLSACEELKVVTNQKQEVAMMDKRMVDFGAVLEQKQLMLDAKRPNLEAAYPLVMADYFAGLAEAGKPETLVATEELESCADHYHNFWINKKLWWPNNDGKPDWESIYVFIVDHYYGFCLKTL